jgi:plasmid maintenance system killer protein
MLDAAGRLDDLRVPPANRLEKLVNDQWRVCFWLNLQTAYDLELERDRLQGRLEREVEVLDEAG